MLAVKMPHSAFVAAYGKDKNSNAIRNVRRAGILEVMFGTRGLAPAADVPPRRKPGRPPKLQNSPPF